MDGLGFLRGFYAIYVKVGLRGHTFHGHVFLMPPAIILAGEASPTCAIYTPFYIVKLGLTGVYTFYF